MSQDTDLEELLQRLLSRQNPPERSAERGTESELIRKVKLFVEAPVNFQPGDTVRWKAGLKNKKLPADGQAAVVIKQLSKPIVTEKDSGTPYFQEPLDLILALIGNSEELVIFYYDKRRFERIESNGARFSEEIIQYLLAESETKIPITA
jgi:hypothetical protein